MISLRMHRVHIQRNIVERRRHGCGMSPFAAVPGQRGGGGEVQGRACRVVSSSYGD